MPCSLRLYFFIARYADMNTSAMITPIKAVETINNTHNALHAIFFIILKI